jgi:RHS repeat-associated protein
MRARRPSLACTSVWHLMRPIEVSGTGYIYVWESNESANTKVWFDDLRVTHAGNFVAQATDYGVWVDVLREQKTEEQKYRFGHQGQFAEKDEETRWSHFELREYDPVIGRWTSRDPYRQYWSPYIGMGNNPVSGVDPDGGYSRFGGWWRSGFSNDIYFDSEIGEWDGNPLLLGQMELSTH